MHKRIVHHNIVQCNIIFDFDGCYGPTGVFGAFRTIYPRVGGLKQVVWEALVPATRQKPSV